MLADFPFGFALDLEAGDINHQVSSRALAGQAIVEIHRLDALAGANIVR